MPSGLVHTAKITAALTVLMAIWWITEAVPIPVTSLLPLLVFPIASGIPMDAVGASYGSSVIFLFMGGFMLALAVQKTGLHHRIALVTIKLVGTKPSRMIAGFMAATAFLSLWISNTATAVMMIPIGVSVLTLVIGHINQGLHQGGNAQVSETLGKHKSNFATALMLGIAYAASVGGMGTLISTPPNVLMAGYLEQVHGVEVSFSRWMLVGVPTAIVMLAVIWFVLVKVLYRPEISVIPGGRELIEGEINKLGRLRRDEKLVLVVFGLAIFGWIVLPLLLPGLPFSDAAVALGAAFLLFILPGKKSDSGVKISSTRLLDWDTAVQLPWGILLLFGGGLALSNQFTTSGLSHWLGEQFQSIGVLPIVLVIFLVTAIVMIMTEITSNTATAATFLPIFGGIALGIGADPMLFAIPVALAATSCFMLPVATPPNAIAYASGHVTIGQMARAGIWLNIVGTVVITGITLTLASWVFGIVY
ncbi:MAG: DASS family sodium-coupled anion symporter [Microbacteriaceae bacterium]|nr:DASS family sodium-coupled anion symporter [Microbacteriaceae bacterium]